MIYTLPLNIDDNKNQSLWRDGQHTDHLWLVGLTVQWEFPGYNKEVKSLFLLAEETVLSLSDQEFIDGLLERRELPGGEIHRRAPDIFSIFWRTLM